MFDVVIIGAGIVGSLLARKLSSYQLSIAVLEKEPDVDLFSVASDEFKQSLILKSDTEN